MTDVRNIMNYSMDVAALDSVYYPKSAEIRSSTAWRVHKCALKCFPTTFNYLFNIIGNNTHWKWQTKL